jgi:hypothetical protein
MVEHLDGNRFDIGLLNLTSFNRKENISQDREIISFCFINDTAYHLFINLGLTNVMKL